MTAWGRDVPPPLREPFAFLSGSGTGEFAPIRRPGPMMAFFAVVCVGAAVAGVVLFGSAPENSRIPAAICMGVIAIAGAVGVWMGWQRARWVGRVKHATGLSPFALEKQGISPQQALHHR